MAIKDDMSIGWNERDYKQTLTKDELKDFKKMPRHEKDALVLEYVADKKARKSSRSEEEYQDNLEQLNRNREDESNRRYSKHGFRNPTSVTRHSYDNQNMIASFDKFYNAFGMLTLNMEKQATYNFYNNQLKQSFMLAAQNDEQIKQHNELLNQNDKIIEQNETIISLLSDIAKK